MTSLSNIFVLFILKYRTIKPLKIPHTYGSTYQFFCTILDKNVYYVIMHEVRFLVWCCLIHVLSFPTAFVSVAICLTLSHFLS